MRRESFERFYFEKVALGEGCGCAEYVTRIRELDELANRTKRAGVSRWPVFRRPVWQRLAAWFRKDGKPV